MVQLPPATSHHGIAEHEVRSPTKLHFFVQTEAPPTNWQCGWARQSDTDPYIEHCFVHWLLTQSQFVRSDKHVARVVAKQRFVSHVAVCTFHSHTPAIALQSAGFEAAMAHCGWHFPPRTMQYAAGHFSVLNLLHDVEHVPCGMFHMQLP